MVPGRPQAVGLGLERCKSRVARLQSDRRIARTEPCFVEVVGFRGQRRPRLRIRLMPLQSQRPFRCMHIRGLELYGTIMPPWRID